MTPNRTVCIDEKARFPQQYEECFASPKESCFESIPFLAGMRHNLAMDGAQVL